jgi:hypothetical protein
MMENKIKKAMLLMFCLVLASCNNSNNDADVTVTSGSGDDSSGSDVPPPTGPSYVEDPFVIHPYLFILTKNSIKFVGDDCPLEDDSCCKIEGNGETVYFIDNENYRIALPDYVVQADEKSFDLDFELPNEDILFIEDKFAEFNDWVGDMSEGRIQSEPMIFRKEINITFSKYGCDFVLLPIDTDMAGITDDYKDTIDTAIIISATKSNDGYFLPIFQCGSTINSDDESPYLSFPHSYIPYSFDYFEDMNCFSTNTLFHEWAHGLHYGYSFISEIDVIKQPEEIIQNLSDLAGGKENICSLSDNDLRYSYTTWHFGDCSQFWDPFQPTCNMNYYSMPECCDGATEECKVYPIPEKFREYNIAWLSHFNFSKEIYFNKLKK